MKNVWERHKVLITGSILLSTVITISAMNLPIFKADEFSSISNQIEREASEEIDDKKEVSINIEKNKEEAGETQNNIKEGKDIQSSSTYSGSEVNDNTSQNMIQAQEKVEATEIKVEKRTNSVSSPIKGDSYTVKKGDSLFLIAERAGVSVDHIKELNNLPSNTIYENQVLRIKGDLNKVSKPNNTSQVANRGERDEDLYWLSRIIHAEAQGESYEGKVAVGNVIINRTKSKQFPNTIKEVVFDKQNGYIQFSPVIDGTIYNAPDAASIQAATDALNGARPVGDALYFLNPRKSTNFWITQNRKYMKTIGLHDFYY